MNEKIFLMRPQVGQEELDLIGEVLESGFLTEGPQVAAFEEKVAAYLGVKYAIATTSCTTALELALWALGIGPGDEVIIPDFTYPATALAVYRLGATPVLVDVDPDTYNITPEAIIQARGPKTRAVIPVSLFGQPLSQEIYDTCCQLGLWVIEDAACSLGAAIQGKKTGTLAHLTCFSFHPRKVITTGEGGMVVTNDEHLAEKIRSLKRFGLRPLKTGLHFVDWGTNYKMSDVQGALGVVQMERLEAIVEERIKKASYYQELLSGLSGILPPKIIQGGRHIFQTYACRLSEPQKRDPLRSFLAQRNIETQIGTFALHLEPAFLKTPRVGDLSNSELLYHSLIALPLHHQLTPEQQEQIVVCIKEFLREDQT